MDGIPLKSTSKIIISTGQILEWRGVDLIDHGVSLVYGDRLIVTSGQLNNNSYQVVKIDSTPFYIFSWEIYNGHCVLIE